jgi:lactoylglutathione lyase
MKIEHIALWVNDLEATKAFYEKYFNAKSNSLYHNKAKNFTSYFLSFENGCRLELMHRPDVSEHYKNYEKQNLGLIHFAISVGSKEKVDSLTNQLGNDGFTIVGKPRTTGDGYYEAVILDPENNIVEINSSS